MSDLASVVHSDGVTIVQGTRVPARMLFEFLAAGDSLDTFLDACPTLSRERATALLEDARW